MVKEDFFDNSQPPWPYSMAPPHYPTPTPLPHPTARPHCPTILPHPRFHPTNQPHCPPHDSTPRPTVRPHLTALMIPRMPKNVYPRYGVGEWIKDTITCRKPGYGVAF